MASSNGKGTGGVITSRRSTPGESNKGTTRRTATTHGGAPATRAQVTALDRDIANLEQQLKRQQGEIGALTSAETQQQGTLGTLGSELAQTPGSPTDTGGTAANPTGSSGGILSSITGGGLTSWLVLAGVAAVGYLGYRYYRQRKGKSAPATGRK